MSTYNALSDIVLYWIVDWTERVTTFRYDTQLKHYKSKYKFRIYMRLDVKLIVHESLGSSIMFGVNNINNGKNVESSSKCAAVYFMIVMM